VPEPIGLDEASGLMAPLARAGHLVLAVSGGPDSVALMVLAAAALLPKVRLSVATVDHGLRSESADEAEQVARWAGNLGLPHETLPWTGPKPRSRLQERAREARYALIADHAVRIGASHVVTAHHADDQAETVLFRLIRGSGPAGLAAMRPESPLGSLVLARPLLGVPKARLVATLQASGHPFVTDPSNADPAFSRARLRRMERALAREGLTRERLTGLARRAARAEDALESVTMAVSARLARPGADGTVEIGPALWREPAEIRLRVLRDAVLSFGRAPLRLERLETASARLDDAAAASQRLVLTLGGAVLDLDRLGKVTIAREKGRRGRPAPD
jgi:tRNA(Ile)-lysidine synthase